MTTGATSISVGATTPMNANVRRVWNDCGTEGRRWRLSRCVGAQPESKPCCPPRGAEVAGARAVAAGSVPRGSATSALGELVAGATHGEHELRQRRIVLDLVAQVAHVDVDRLLVLVERLVVAQQLEELAPAEHAPRPAREMAEDLELRRGEADPARAPLDASPFKIDHEVPVPDHAAPGRVREVAVRAPEERPDPAQQLTEGKRLGDVVVRPELQAHHLVELVAARGEEQDGRLGAGRAQPAEYLEPVDARQLHVQKDEVGRLRGRELQPLLSRGRDGYLVALLLEGELD